MVGTSSLFGFLTSDGTRDEIELVDEIGSHQNIIAAAAYSNGTYALVAEYRTSEDLWNPDGPYNIAFPRFKMAH